MSFPAGNLLIDTTPEMRLQLLREKIRFVHAIAFTHYHVDHLFGLDDARVFPKYIGTSLPIYCEPETEQVIRRIFDYAFNQHAETLPPGYLPRVEFRSIEPDVSFTVLGQTVLPIRLEHGRFRVLGFRVGDLAYCTDVSKIPEQSWSLLEGLDVLILDTLRVERHPTHLSLGEALEVVERLKPKRTFLTHLSHSLDHGPTEAILPPHVRLAYDGLSLEF
jgi:phosphoribosyl 1,2-cyclic phosphate phosphodiesterase